VGSDRQVRVIDLWAGADREALDDLLAGLLTWARSRGAASAACGEGGLTHVREALVRFGFRPRGPETAIAVSPSGGNAPRPDPNKWYFLLADEDYN
jgi:hypothetical protein